jgi:hypothetical protein
VKDSEYPQQPAGGDRTREIGTRTVAVGSALFLLAFVLLLPFYDRLEAAGRSWWVWTCLSGFGLGVIGWDYCRRRRNHRQAGEAYRT